MHALLLRDDETQVFPGEGFLNGFILDENVPQRITFVARLPIIPAFELGRSPSDSSLWEYACEREYAIITKDADFTNRILLSSSPPWVVHLRIGNMRKREYHALLHRIWPRRRRYRAGCYPLRLIRFSRYSRWDVPRSEKPLFTEPTRCFTLL
jgi:predicted nuclease of predicted toxin-antitoxin system